MTSVFLTRRTLLGSGALMGLGALLAACGQQANNEATATASAAPSETASDSAAASESPSASATPRVTRGYSGNSKAPDGEYRKAGDCSYAFKYVTEDAEEYEFYLYIQGLYQRGGWAVDGLDSYQPEGPLIYDEAKKMYRMMHRRFWGTVMYVESDGHLIMQANTEHSDDNFYFFFIYSDGYWKIAGSKAKEEM